MNADEQISRPGRDGRRDLLFLVSCPGQASELRWATEGVTVEELATLAFARLRDQLPKPKHEINPSPDVGGTVNLGMWLAVTPEPDRHMHAELGNVWVDLTATLHETKFEFGNGDEKTCLGTGTPYGDRSTIEEGPCGYTYTEIPPPDPYTLTVTSSWTIDGRSSGGPLDYDPTPRTSTYRYPVKEIQTVGEAG